MRQQFWTVRKQSLSTMLEKSLLSAGHLHVRYNACRRGSQVVQQWIHEKLFLYCVALHSTLSYQNHHCFTELLKTLGKCNNQATGTWEAPAVLGWLLVFDCYKFQRESQRKH